MGWLRYAPGGGWCSNIVENPSLLLRGRQAFIRKRVGLAYLDFIVSCRLVEWVGSQLNMVGGFREFSYDDDDITCLQVWTDIPTTLLNSGKPLDGCDLVDATLDQIDVIDYTLVARSMA